MKRAPLSIVGLVSRRSQRSSRFRHSLKQQLRMFSLGFGALVFFLGAGIMLATGFIYAQLVKQLPSPSAIPALLDPPAGILLQPTRLFDRTGGHLIFELANPGISRKNLTVDTTKPDHFSPDLVQVTLAVFDPTIHQHPGILFTGVLDDQINTLAERLVSDFLLDQEAPSLRRTLRLRLLAVQLTRTYGRNRIIEWYLNSAYFGHLAYGAETAAQLYLGKSASQLNLAEAALLVAVAQAPALNPLDAPEAARQAQRQLIATMLNRNQISSAQAEQASAVQVTFSPAPAAAENSALAFSRLAIDQVSALIGRERLERGGLVIYTTLDYDLQTQLHCTTLTELEKITTSSGAATISYRQGCPAANLLPALPLRQELPENELAASAVLLDPQTGQVLALLGDTTLKNGESTLFLAHPAGSLWTPFIYLAGFSRGYSPASLVWDIPASLPPFASQEHNPDGQFHGPTRLRLALANDYLAPAAQLLSQIGPENVWTLVTPFGLPIDTAAGLPFSGGNLTPLQAAQAYGILANQGVLAGQAQHNGQSLQPVLVMQVIGIDGHIWLDWRSGNSRPIISSSLAYLINNVLTDEAARWPSLGYPNVLEIGRPSGAKLGQAIHSSDTWTAGYTPQLVTVVWIGSQNQESTGEILDPRLAGGLWNAITKYAHQELPPTGWVEPPGISRVDVCDPSGLLPTRDCQNIVNEVFLAGNEPAAYDSLYQTFQINRETSQLATVFTAPELIEERTFLVIPPEARSWAASLNLPVPPTTYDTIQPSAQSPLVNISAPALFNTVNGKITIRGSASGENFTSYQVQVGQGLNPRSWLQLSDPVKQTVEDGILVTWDTTLTPDGLYAIRLLVIRAGQELESTYTQVTVDNTPPLVNVLFPASNQMLQGTKLTFKAQASDTAALDRLEWWVGDRLVGTTTQPPFHFVWQGTPGKYTLVVRAYDTAGNLSASPAVTFTLAK